MSGLSLMNATVEDIIPSCPLTQLFTPSGPRASGPRASGSSDAAAAALLDTLYPPEELEQQETVTLLPTR